MFDLVIPRRKQLCPVLISLLGVPKVEKGGITQRSQSHDEGSSKGLSVLSSSSNHLGSSAKIIYRWGQLDICFVYFMILEGGGVGVKLTLSRSTCMDLFSAGCV